jgi:hypothetical protein
VATLDNRSLRIRLRRVESQVKRIEASYRRFEPRLERYRLRVEPNEDRTEHIERIYMDWRIRDWWSVAVGEIMHNLRATLDNLVWQLVIGNNDHKPGKQHEFPIASDEGWYEENAPRKLCHVPAAARTIIDQVQPYRRPAKELRAHPLWVVHNLNRIDKHHLLHVVAAYAPGAKFEATPEMVAAKAQLRLWYRPLESGTEIRAILTPAPFDGEVPVSTPAPLNVVVGETDETPFYPFPGVLRNASNGVNEVLDAIVAAIA